MTKYISGGTTAAGVALTVFQGEVIVAFPGGGGLGGASPNYQLNLMPVNPYQPNEQDSFNRLHVMEDTSSERPALAVFNNHLWIAWTGLDPLHRLNLVSFPQLGAQPDFRVVFNGTAVGGPALTVYNNLLVMAWCGGGGLGGGQPNGQINLGWSTDGRSWPNETNPGIVLNQTSWHGPALAPMISEGGPNAGLLLAWTGTDEQMYVGRASEMRFDQFNDPQGNKQITDEYSEVGPGMASFNRYPFTGSDWSVTVSWAGKDSPHNLNQMGAGENSTTVGYKQTYTDTSPFEPAVCHAADSSDNWVYAWAGADGVHRLNVALESDLHKL